MASLWRVLLKTDLQRRASDGRAVAVLEQKGLVEPTFSDRNMNITLNTIIKAPPQGRMPPMQNECGGADRRPGRRVGIISIGGRNAIQCFMGNDPP